MDIPNLKDYHECSPIDIAKRRGIYVSEVNDAIIELSKQVSDIYTFAITDNEESIAEGTDVIFGTSDGNFVWYPDGDFELIGNFDPKEEYVYNPREGLKGKTRWDYLRQDDRYGLDYYLRNEKVQQRRKETIASDRNRYAREIKKRLVFAGADSSRVYINPRAHDLSVKVSTWGIRQIGSVEQTIEIIEDTAKSLGISVSAASKRDGWKEVVIASVPYYNQ